MNGVPRGCGGGKQGDGKRGNRKRQALAEFVERKMAAKKMKASLPSSVPHCFVARLAGRHSRARGGPLLQVTEPLPRMHPAPDKSRFMSNPCPPSGICSSTTPRNMNPCLLPWFPWCFPRVVYPMAIDTSSISYMKGLKNAREMQFWASPAENSQRWGIVSCGTPVIGANCIERCRFGVGAGPMSGTMYPWSWSPRSCGLWPPSKAAKRAESGRKRPKAAESGRKRPKAAEAGRKRPKAAESGRSGDESPHSKVLAEG